MPAPAHPTDGDHTRGNPHAAVTLLEYGDYECPYCAAAAPVLRDLVVSSEGRVRLVFRNFPVPDVHPYALTAALAAEASAPHGVFWPMHDLLFTHQHRLTDADLRSYAESLGVDGGEVIGDAAQPFGDKVEADFASAVELGVRGTPWLFVDGEVYRGRIDSAELRRTIEGSARPPRFVPRTRRKAR